jgi:hypothetical protein
LFGASLNVLSASAPTPSIEHETRKGNEALAGGVPDTFLATIKRPVVNSLLTSTIVPPAVEERTKTSAVVPSSMVPALVEMLVDPAPFASASVTVHSAPAGTGLPWALSMVTE